MPDARRSGDGSYWLYVLRCGDGTFYTGIALDVDARLAEHRGSDAVADKQDAGSPRLERKGVKYRGAKYLQGRGPVTVVYRHPVGDRSRAQRLEYRVRKLPRPRKLALIGGALTLDALDE